MKNIKHFFSFIVVFFLVLSVVVRSSPIRQNKLFSNIQAPMAAYTSLEQSSLQIRNVNGEIQSTAIMDEEQTRGWKTYQQSSIGFTFRYPPNFVLSRQRNKIKLYHSIKFKYLDPCDYSGDTKFLSRLVDFSISFELARGKDREKNRQPGASDEHPNASPGSVKQSGDDDSGRFVIGSLKGEFEPIIFEGCGEYRYRFPLAGDQVLLVQREIIGIFSGAAQQFGDDELALKQRGIINPEQEQLYFNTILSTFKLAETKPRLKR